MSNPFDDLKTEESPDEEGNGSDDEIDAEPSSDSTRSEDQTPTRESTSTTAEQSTQKPSVERRAVTDDSDEPQSPAKTGPAFEYSEVKQKPFYARTETVNAFENEIRTTIVPKLAEADVIDEETREIHDAVLRLATEEPERIAELVLEERRQSDQ